MNSLIYRAGTEPEYCYVVVTGNVKLESVNFSAKRLMELSVVGERAVFGDADLNEPARIQSAFCCSAYCKLLILRK
jgi:CRP-like cAMP-binding protein